MKVMSVSLEFVVELMNATCIYVYPSIGQGASWVKCEKIQITLSTARDQ